MNVYNRPTASARVIAVGMLAHILREASAVIRSTAMGITGASKSRTGNRYGSHAFF